MLSLYLSLSGALVSCAQGSSAVAAAQQLQSLKQTEGALQFSEKLGELKVRESSAMHECLTWLLFDRGGGEWGLTM